MTLFKNIRFYVLVFSVILSIYLYLTIDSVVLLTQRYALTAAIFLYLTLLAGPLCYSFKFLPFRVQYIKARRALGVSAFYFAFIHANFGFFQALGGFGALTSLSAKHLIAVALGFTALIILTMMAATAFDSMIEKLGFKKWKALHRFVYLVGILVLTHAVLIGSDFQTINVISVTSYMLIAFLIVLEIPRVIKWIRS